MPAIAPQEKRKARPLRHPGLMRHARELGVDFSHLYRVLEGQRVSASLLRRYQELVAKESAQ